MAQQCRLAVADSGKAEILLAQLLSTGEVAEMSAEITDAFHAQILTALLKYQPGPLSIRLRQASDQLLPDREGHKVIQSTS